MPSSNLTLVVKPGEILKSFGADDAQLFVKKWLSAFGQNRPGLNTNSFMWHLFSAGRFPSISGQEALDAYSNHEAAEYIVLSNDRKSAISTITRPEKCSVSDYYVFPENLAWTLAMTHENGWLGPYFAYHKDYKLLNHVNIRNNQARLTKLNEMAIAKSKGWV